MPISQNIKETGWFYHAPAKRNDRMEKVDAPVPSQIPGIGFDQPVGYEKEDVKEMMFKETDSNYIRLAKMGGRKDLLSFNPDKVKHRQNHTSQGYTRSDWFYLEDNRLEDEEKKTEEKQQWDFLLPEYMVHKGYQPSFEDPTTPPTRGSAPYHTEKMSISEREDRSATDKTVKIPEFRRPGYGVRNEKPPPRMHQIPPREVPAAPAVRIKCKTQGFSTHNETNNPTSMTKLLSGEYEREWYQKHDEVEKSKWNAKTDRQIDHTSASGNRSDQNGLNVAAQRQKSPDESERELFKLQRFKNVPSKVDSYQAPEIMAAAK